MFHDENTLKNIKSATLDRLDLNYRLEYGILFENICRDLQKSKCHLVFYEGLGTKSVPSVQKVSDEEDVEKSC